MNSDAWDPGAENTTGAQIDRHDAYSTCHVEILEKLVSNMWMTSQKYYFNERGKLAVTKNLYKASPPLIHVVEVL
jgi:hypothetical protein